MKISISRETLLPALQAAANVVDRRQSQPVLGNVLVTATNNGLHLVATDLEVEVALDCGAEVAREGAVTLPARKLLDIARSLPAEATLQIEASANKARVQSGRSKFSLATLPAEDFPNIGNFQVNGEMALSTAMLLELIGSTFFAMAHQDVRYYLNGLLLELSDNQLRAVATDGHRLALCDRQASVSVGAGSQLIVPRKGVQEIQRMLGHLDGEAKVSLGDNHLRVSVSGQAITTKLIDGKFPDYQRVIPKQGDRVMNADREALKAALGRTSILSNEKFRGVRLQLSSGLLRASTHNPEQEEAEEELEVSFEGESLEIGFNVSYLLDVLGVIKSETVRFEMSDANSSAVIYSPDEVQARYVVMPMRL